MLDSKQKLKSENRSIPAGCKTQKTPDKYGCVRERDGMVRNGDGDALARNE